MTAPSPSKKLRFDDIDIHQQQEDLEEASEEMGSARDRLADLLRSIQAGQLAANIPRPKPSTAEEPDEKRGPGRPRKTTKDRRRVIFELRGKPFGMKDGDGIESVYALCKLWLKNRDEKKKDDEDEETHTQQKYEDSLDLLATKEIHQLPRPTRAPSNLRAWPERCERWDEVIQFDNPMVGLEDIRATYVEHWKNVKRNWVKHSRKVNERFYKSINLLETVHNIAQQNSL